MNPRSRRKRQESDPAESQHEDQVQDDTAPVQWEPVTPDSPTPSPWTLYLPGLLLVAGAGALAGVGEVLPSLVQATAKWNLTPGILAAAGLGLLAAGYVMKGMRRIAGRLDGVDERAGELARQNEVIRTGLADLGSIDVAAKLAQVASGMAPSEIQASLAKMDEKLNNLTKAVRMLTQPLEETTGIMPELDTRLGQALEEIGKTREALMAKLERFDQDLPNLTVRRLTETIPEQLNPIREEIGDRAAETERVLQETRDHLEQAFGSLRMGFNEELKQDMDLIQDKITGLEELTREAVDGTRDMAEKVTGMTTEHGDGKLQQEMDLVREKIGALEELSRESLDQTRNLADKVAGMGEGGGGPHIDLEDIGTIRRSVDQVLETIRSLDFRTQQAPAQAAQEQAGAEPAPHRELQPAAAGPGPAPAAEGRKPTSSVLSSIQKLKKMKGI